MCKRTERCAIGALQGLGMDVDPSKPLVAVVSRLVGQKNPGLMHVSAACSGNGRGSVYAVASVNVIVCDDDQDDDV